jgi:hypothetical protein
MAGVWSSRKEDDLEDSQCAIKSKGIPSCQGGKCVLMVENNRQELLSNFLWFVLVGNSDGRRPVFKLLWHILQNQKPRGDETLFRKASRVSQSSFFWFQVFGVLVRRFADSRF